MIFKGRMTHTRTHTHSRTNHKMLIVTGKHMPSANVGTQIFAYGFLLKHAHNLCTEPEMLIEANYSDAP